MEFSSECGIAAMAREGTVAVLLPGSFYFLRETKLPPIDVLRRHGVPIALATDHNPGSSPVSSPLAILNLGCTLFRLTPEEALAGMTRHAARALGLQTSHGTLEPGKNADLALWDIGAPAELAYALGANPCVGRVRGGRILPPARAAAGADFSPKTH
jgi:imidazolonepropionase